MRSMIRCSLFRIAAVSLCLAAAPLAAQPYTYTISSNQSTTITLPAGGGSALVEPGVTLNPASTAAIQTQTNDTWSITNEGNVSSGSSYALRPAGSTTLINKNLITGYYGISQSSAPGNSLSIDNQAGATLNGSYQAVYMQNGSNLHINNAGQMLTATGYATISAITNSGLSEIINSGTIRNNNVNGGAINMTLSDPGLRVINQSGGQIIGGSGTNSNSCGITTLHSITTVQNDAGATISGGSGICGSDLFTIVIVTNDGQITGDAETAVYLYGGGETHNRATISGVGGVAFVRSVANTGNLLINSGTIIGSGTTAITNNSGAAGSGIGVFAGGTPSTSPMVINNQSDGTITGGVYGIYIGNGSDDGAADIRNAGTINAGSSGTAIRFSQHATKVLNNSLTLDTGSTLNGNVLGGIGPGTDSLILNGTGSEAASKFANFEKLTVDTSLVNPATPFWTLNNNGSFSVASTVTRGTLRITGQLTTPTLTIAANGTLAGNGTVVGNTDNSGTVAPGSGAAIGTFNTLTLQGDYTAHSALNLRTQLGGDASPTDKLVVTGTVSGTTAVTVSNLGGSGAATTSGILVIDTPAGTPANAFSLTGSSVTAGNYRYTLDQGSDSKWYLNAVFVPPPLAAAAIPVDTPLPLIVMALLLAAIAATGYARKQSRAPRT